MEEFVGCKAHKYEPKPEIVCNPVYNPLAQVSLLTGNRRAFCMRMRESAEWQ